MILVIKNMQKGKVIMKHMKEDKVLISANDLDYLMLNTELLKTKKRDYDELNDKYNKAIYELNELTKKSNQKYEEKINRCDICEVKFASKSAYNVHLNSLKHNKNVTMHKLMEKHENIESESEDYELPEIKEYHVFSI